jgi:hypothetical protein
MRRGRHYLYYADWRTELQWQTKLIRMVAKDQTITATELEQTEFLHIYVLLHAKPACVCCTDWLDEILNKSSFNCVTQRRSSYAFPELNVIYDECSVRV